MSVSSGGGGGGDGGDDGGGDGGGSDGDGTDGRPRGGDDGGGGGGGLSASDVARIVRSLLPSWVKNPPRVLRAFLERPIATITTIVVGWIFQDIVLPIVRGVLQTATAVVAAILTLAASIVQVGSLLINGLVGGVAPVGAALLNTVAEFNSAIGQVAADAGLAAPTIVTLLYGIEIGIAGFLVISLIESIDVPLVDLGGILRALTAPIKFVVGVLR